jgi:hypothetical protein
MPLVAVLLVVARGRAGEQVHWGKVGLEIECGF